jgi:PAS domain S-box-containing protein
MENKLDNNLLSSISTNSFQKLLEAIAEAYLVINSKLDIIRLSPTAKEKFGNSSNLKIHLNSEQISSIETKIAEQTTVFQQPLELSFNGNRYWIVYSLLFLKDDNKNEILFLYSLKSEENFYRSNHQITSISLDYTMEIIVFLDEKFNYSFVSNSFKKILGYRDFDVLGLSCLDLMHPESKRASRDLLSQLKADNLFNESEIVLRSKLGKYLTFICKIHSISNSNSTYKYLITGIDISIFKEKENKLTYDLEFFRNLYDASPDLVFLSTISDRKIVNCNKKAVEVLGFKHPSQIIGRNTSSFRKKPVSSEDLDKYSRIYESGQEYSEELEWLDNNGNCFWASVTIKKINILGTDYELKRITDISRVKSFETIIRLGEQRQQLYQKQTPLGYIEWNLNFEVIEWNQSSERIFGYTKEEIMGKHASIIIPKEVQPQIIESVWKELLNKTGGSRSTNININKNGQVIHCEWYNSQLSDAEGNILGVASMVLDNTEAVHANSELLKSLNEKEVLLSEIHHRVKNNLAVVSGLLFLQSEAIKDEPTKQLFKESETRIKSMALIHEKLYNTDNFSAIKVGDYFRDLWQSILASYQFLQNVLVDFEIEDKEMSMNVGLTYGLILNELITNSLKYAFAAVKQPVIFISWQELDGNHVLIYKDNGIGFNWESALNKGNSIGLELINALILQLRGTMSFKNDNGAYFQINCNPIS